MKRLLCVLLLGCLLFTALPEARAAAPVYTQEEQAYIAGCRERGKTFWALACPDEEPYCLVQDGAVTGFMAQLVRELSARTGLDIQIDPEQSIRDYYQLAQPGRIDFILDTYPDPYLEDAGYTTYAPYFQFECARLTRRDHTGPVSTVSCIADADTTNNYLEAVFDVSQLTYRFRIRDCVEDVVRGRCDAAYLPAWTAELEAARDPFGRLTAERIPGFYGQNCISIKSGADPRFGSVLTKAMASITPEELADLAVGAAGAAGRETSFMAYIRSSPLRAAVCWALLGLLTLAAVGCVIWRVRQRKQRRRAAATLPS